MKIKQKGIGKKTNGRWTNPQHDRFLKGLEKYGRDWVSVQKVVKTRTLVQVRSHAQKVFLKLSDEDIDALIDKPDFDDSDVIPYDEESEQCETVSREQEKNQLIGQKNEKRTMGNLLSMFMQAIENSSSEMDEEKMQGAEPANSHQVALEFYQKNIENSPITSEMIPQIQY